MQEIAQVYYQLLHQQKFVEASLDYSIFERHLPVLRILADVSNSGISVFDLYQKKHIYYSPNFCLFLGYDLNDIIEQGQQHLDAKVHPEDSLVLLKNGISLLKLYFEFSRDEKMNYKAISEYRIQNTAGEYIRVIEQHQPLELDKYGNLWLAVSTVDISPNQGKFDGVNAKILNIKTGEIMPLPDENLKPEVELTKREKEILQLVHSGLLSKEISDQLSISIHTVNTHRQRLLEKLGANNSMEAVVFASRFGLLE